MSYATNYLEEIVCHGTLKRMGNSTFQFQKKPCFKGNRLLIKIQKETYNQGLEICQNNLNGRLIIHKGFSPLNAYELCERMKNIWSPITTWELIPLGHRYFEITFQSREDLNQISSMGTWNIKTLMMHISIGTPNFRLENLKVTNTKVWLQIHGLPLEYWEPKILFSIATELGIPLSLDRSTRQRIIWVFCKSSRRS